MASRFFRRSLSIRSTLLTRRFNNLSTIPYIDGEKREESHSSASKIETFLAQRRSLGCYMNNTFCRTPYGLYGNGMYLRRGISTSSGEANEAVVSTLEVVIAASDSAFPVAAVQYLIDGVHTLTGWASIAIATLLVHGATVPLYIKVLRKHSLKLQFMLARITMMKRQAEAIVDRDPLAAEKEAMKMMDVLNMAEKVPSFKTGGILWFADLSTPDAMYIFPISVAFISIIETELVMKNVKILMGYNRTASNESITIPFAAIWLPLTMSWPNAVFCFWISSRMFFICFRYVVRYPRVKKALGIADKINK
ncbi:hypothetical protein V2J09_001488 [Rumex salicifolius]